VAGINSLKFFSPKGRYIVAQGKRAFASATLGFMEHPKPGPTALLFKGETLLGPKITMPQTERKTEN